MKKLIMICCLFMMAGALFTSCENESIEIEEIQGIDHNMIKDLDGKNNLGERGVPISYYELCGSTGQVSYSGSNNLSNPDSWHYYSFEGSTGDYISVTINGVGMLAAMSFYYGTTSYTGSFNWYDGGPDMTYLGHYDPPCGGGTTFYYTLPYTGTYTLAVLNEYSCGQVYEYSIQTTGINCNDNDGDGVPNEEDPHPNSILSSQLSVDGCYAGVSNLFVVPGTTMADEVNDVINSIWDILNNNNVRRGYDPQKKFQREMGILLTKWYYAGLITDRQKFEITKCVRNSRIFNRRPR